MLWNFFMIYIDTKKKETNKWNGEVVVCEWRRAAGGTGVVEPASGPWPACPGPPDPR